MKFFYLEDYKVEVFLIERLVDSIGKDYVYIFWGIER